MRKLYRYSARIFFVLGFLFYLTKYLPELFPEKFLCNFSKYPETSSCVFLFRLNLLLKDDDEVFAVKYSGRILPSNFECRLDAYAILYLQFRSVKLRLAKY